MSGYLPSFGAQVAIDRHLDELDRQEADEISAMPECAYPGCGAPVSVTLAFRATDADGTRWYCDHDCWDAHVCGLGIPADAR